MLSHLFICGTYDCSVTRNEQGEKERVKERERQRERKRGERVYPFKIWQCHAIKKEKKIKNPPQCLSKAELFIWKQSLASYR